MDKDIQKLTKFEEVPQRNMKRRGKFVRKEAESPRNNIDKIRVISQGDNYVDVECRFNFIEKQSQQKMFRIPLPNPSKDEGVHFDVEGYLSSHVQKELKKFYRGHRRNKIKVPSTINFEASK